MRNIKCRVHAYETRVGVYHFQACRRTASVEHSMHVDRISGFQVLVPVRERQRVFGSDIKLT